MIKLFQYSSKLLLMALISVFLLSSAGCKSKKKAMEAKAAAERARLEQEAATQREKEAELQRQRDAEEKARREAESRNATPVAQRLDLYFNNIANSANPNAAISSINEALTLFASPETPVLIIISQEGGQKDYDRPTTIREYLNYLKDTKKSMNKIANMQTDGSGKITELELIKQQ